MIRVVHEEAIPCNHGGITFWHLSVLLLFFNVHIGGCVHLGANERPRLVRGRFREIIVAICYWRRLERHIYIPPAKDHPQKIGHNAPHLQSD